jgi:hypothetical protein
MYQVRGREKGEIKLYNDDVKNFFGLALQIYKKKEEKVYGDFLCLLI